MITHLAVAMNVGDLYNEVKKRCPDETPIPSIQWLRLQFWPRNGHVQAASAYTGKLKVRFMVQARQYRLSHVDMHCASVLFRYEREFAICYRTHTTFASLDKHTVKLASLTTSLEQ